MNLKAADGGIYVRAELGFLSPKAETGHKPHLFFSFFLVVLSKISVYLAENKQKTPQSSTPQSTAFIKVTGLQKKIKYHRRITYTRMKKKIGISLPQIFGETAPGSH